MNLQQSGLGVAITGSGSAAPLTTLDNEGLSKLVDTSDEWIASRTGIRQRRLATSAESVTTIAMQAAQGAIAMAGLSPMDLDLIILATSTADDLFGSASQIQGELGAQWGVISRRVPKCSLFGCKTLHIRKHRHVST